MISISYNALNKVLYRQSSLFLRQTSVSHPRTLYLPHTSFHSSSICLGGRKGGASALDPMPRPMSKKQKKRRAARKVTLSEKRDPAKEKLRDRVMKKRMESPEMDKYVDSVENSLSGLFDALKLPSNVDDWKDVFDGVIGKPDEVNMVDAEAVLRNLLNLETNQEPTSSTDKITSDKMISTKLETDIVLVKNKQNVNLAIQKFCRYDQRSAFKLLSLMESHNISLNIPSYTAIINLYNNHGQHKIAEKMIEKVMASADLIPDLSLWNAVIATKAHDNPKQALHIIETTLRAAGINATIDMLNSIMKTYVHNRQHEDVKMLWRRMHCDCELNIESFHIMLQYCAVTKQAERAFFYYDELKVLKLSPTVDTFIHLIRAAAEAPHYESGFQDTIFDAMTYFEGTELQPTKELYNSVIYAFSKANDAVAAEFYFWEMKRKGFQPDRDTYRSLLQAYAKNCSVNIKEYGYKGRYVRQLERKYTRDEQAFADVGPEKSFKILSSGLTHNGPLDRGKRQMSKLEDMADDDELYGDSIIEDMHEEAKRVRATRKNIETTSAKQLQDDIKKRRLSLFEGDAELESLLSAGSKGKAINAAPHDDNTNLIESMMKALSSGEVDDASSMVADVNMEEKPRLGRVKRGKIPTRRNKAKDHDLSSDHQDDVSSSHTTEVNVSSVKPSPVSLYDDADKELLQQGIQVKHTISNDDIRGKQPSSKNYRYLFQERYTVDPNLRRSQMMMRFDNSFQDPFIGKISIASPSSLGSADIRDRQRLEDNSLLQLLDHQPTTSSKSSSKSASKSSQQQKEKEKKMIADDHNDHDDMDEWDMVEFGRAPDPDYTLNPGLQRRLWMQRAKTAFHEMERQGMKPDPHTLSSYLSVFCESLRVDEAMEVMSMHSPHLLQPNHRSYHALIRMYIRLGDLDSAIQYKNEALANKIKPSGDSFGMIIHSHMQQDQVVEALKVLEEAAKTGMKVPDYHLRQLRHRCNELGVIHPNMPADPREWVKKVNVMRRNQKSSSKSKIEDLRSIL